MRKLVTFLFLTMISIFLLETAKATTCAGAAVVPGAPTFPWVSALTCGATNDITSANATVCGSTSLYLGGNEAVYAWTPTGNYANVTFAYTGQTYTGLFLYQGCPTSGGICVANFTSSASSKTLAYVGTNLITGTPISLTSGTTYYLVIDTWPTPNSPCPGTLTINGTLLLPCTTPAAQPTALILTPAVTTIGGSFTASATANNYLVVRSTSSSLSSNPVNGTVYAAGNALGGGSVVSFGTTTTFSTTGLTPSTLYYFFVFATNYGTCSGGPLYLTTAALAGNSTTLAPIPLCGTKTVGAGGDYVNLTAATTALASSILTCPVTLSIRSDYSSAAETWPIIVPVVLGSSVTNTITIKPAVGVTAAITGTPAAGGVLIKIYNSNTILDGSNAVGGTTRDLTITNNSLTTPQVLFVGSSGTTPVTNLAVKNCNLINGDQTSSAFVFGDQVTGGGYFNNITVQNNSIRKAYIAFYYNLIATSGNGNNTLITGNSLNTTGVNSIRLCGIYLQGADGVTVSNNNIGNFANTADAGNITGIWCATSTSSITLSGNTIGPISGSLGAPRGIFLSPTLAAANITVTGNTVTGITGGSSSYTLGIGILPGYANGGISISKNNVNNIQNTSAGGWGSIGILGATTLTTANIAITNNLVYNVAAYGFTGYTYTDNGYGIDLQSGGGYTVLYNTVYMNTAQSSAGYPAAMNIESGCTTAGSIDLRNNIFSNTGTMGTPYSIISSAANTVFSNINYNDYWCAGVNLGYIAATNRVTLADIQAGFGGNANSQNINPTFAGTDLHPTNAALMLKGLYMSAYSTDYAGANRSDPTDIGAYQWSPNQAVTTVGSANLTTTNATINGSITAANLNVTSGFEYGLTVAYGTAVAATPASITGNTATAISATLTGLTVNNTYHYRAKGTSGSSVINGADMTFSTAVAPIVATSAATLVGASFATLNGTINPKDAPTTVSFEYGLTTAYGSGANVTGPFIGNTVQNFSATLSGLTINTTYHFRAKAVNAVGTYYGTDMTFFTTCVIPPVPGAISGAASVCKNGSGYVYSVAPVPYAFVYNWNFPAGFTITTFPNSNTVTVSVSGAAVSGTISVVAASDCGALSPASTTAVTVNNLPVPTVAGNSPVCQSAGNNYTTQAGQSAYVWTATPDGTVTPTGNPQVVTITWAATGTKTVGVVYTNPATGCTAAAPGGTITVTVNAAPVPTIVGNNNMCANSGYYDYTTETGKTGYVWSVSSGGSITAGQGTAVAQVVWNTPGAQSVSVNYNNASNCSAPSPTVYNVTVSGIPGGAGTISGASFVCFGTSGSYSVPAITNATSYVWSLPAGASIASGAGTNSITVNYAPNAVSGDITVYGNSICGNGTASAPFAVTIMQLPLAAGTVTGPSSVCGGEMGVAYSVPPVTNASAYTWNLPAGATIASGANTPDITVDFANGATSGNISVFGTNICGIGAVSPNFAVTVTPLPAAPLIYSQGDTLFSNAPIGNQWYYEGAPIATGTGQTLVAAYTGWYWDVVTVNGCSSDTSNHIHIFITGIEDPKASSFVVYPVPNNGMFKLVMNSLVTGSFDISICNNIGAAIYTKQNVELKGSPEMMIDLRPIPAGIYTMIIRNGESKVVRKIIVN